MNPAIAEAYLPVGELDAPAARSVATVSELFRDHVGFAWRMLRQLGVGDADLEDQTQEVFLVVHRKHAFFGGEHPRAWIYAICRRVASAYRRRGYRRNELGVTAPEPVEAPHDFDLLAALDRALEDLDEDKRTVFVLHDVEELSMHEVAATAGCPLQTAYARLYAARRLLAKALGDPS